MPDASEPQAHMDVDVRIQPGPDGTPWESLNLTFGLIGCTIVVPPGMLAQLGANLPGLVEQAREKAIEEDNARLREQIAVIPASAMDNLPDFSTSMPSATLNRASRRHPNK